MLISVFTPLKFTTDFELITQFFSVAQKRSATLFLKEVQDSGETFDKIKFPTITRGNQFFCPEVTLNTLSPNQRHELMKQIEQVTFKKIEQAAPSKVEQVVFKPIFSLLEEYPDCKDLVGTQEFIDYKASGDARELAFTNVTQDFLHQVALAKCEGLTLTDQSTSLSLDNMPHLKVLNISGSASISGAAHNLKKLNSSGCDLRSLKFEQMQKLKSLSISSNKWLTVIEKTTFTSNNGLSEKTVYEQFESQRTLTVFHVPQQVTNFTCVGAQTLPDKILFNVYSKLETFTIDAPQISCELVNLEHLAHLKRMNIDAAPKVVTKLPASLEHLVISVDLVLNKKKFDFTDWEKYFAGAHFPKTFTIKSLGETQFCGDARIKCENMQVLRGKVF